MTASNAANIAATFNANKVDETRATPTADAIVSAYKALAGQPVSEADRVHAMAMLAWLLKHDTCAKLDFELCA